MYDLVVPCGNERDLLARAKYLNLKLIFLYSFSSKGEAELKKKQLKGAKIGLLIRPKSRHDLKKAQNFYSHVDLVIFSTSDEEIIKLALSSAYVDIVIDMSTASGRDHTHYRRSNINQVIAKIAVEGNTAYSVNFTRLLNLNSTKRSRLIGREMQNVRFFKKYKVPVFIASFATVPLELRNWSDLSSIGRVLGINNVDNIKSILIEKTKKSSVIRNGVKIVNGKD